MKDNYCCFNCPEPYKNKDRDLEDICPSCGKKYGFPLKEFPEKIQEYQIIKPLGRGFYSVIYKVESTKFKNRFFALKVIPQNIYKFFDKDFYVECQEHSDLSENSEHIVRIENYFDTDILFSDKNISCHVAVLEFIEGDSIEKIIKNDIHLNAEEFTQTAIDLFRILVELRQKSKRHNDLNEKNIIIQRLRISEYRHDAIDPKIRAKAIDINSSKENKEEYLKDRPRDIQNISRIIRALSNKVLQNPDDIDDLSYRAATKLFEIAYELDTYEEDYRHRELSEITDTIKLEFEASQIGIPPWKKEFRLKRINDFYNAQALDSWHVNNLFVDPDDKWLSDIGSPGPQLITGMRGCGKTILLKSLEFHARAVEQNRGESQESIISRLKSDGYVGVYASSSRLIDITGKDKKERYDPFSILFIGFLLSAIRTIKHLFDIKKELVTQFYYRNFIELIVEIIPDTKNIRDTVITDTLLNIELEKIQNSLLRGEKKYNIKIKPIFAFENLAKVIRKTSSLWENHHVFFLLDDVSTRYINVELIKKLISQLLLQNETYSFKITSEEHIIGYILHSPGNIEVARPGRDYSLYDLGSEVKETIHGKYSKHRKGFIENILKKRLEFNKVYDKKNYYPLELLGNASLKDIAINIATAKKTSKERKRVYHGFNALTAMCVGDIGDILNVYDRFVTQSKNKGGRMLTPPEQTKTYLDFCSHRLYDLNRLKSEMRHYALGFAEASYELLVESVKKDPSFKRIRQYNSIYISITSEDEKKQKKLLEKINNMIDAGIFVSAGLAFRSKQHQTNPLLQFTLTFRKIFGLSNYIGLSEADRFELTGKGLVEWLNNPGKDICKTILKSNLSKEKINVDYVVDDEIEIVTEKKSEVEPLPTQQDLFEEIEKKIIYDLFKPSLPKITVVKNLNELQNKKINMLIIGLGFEVRALKSIKRYSKNISPDDIKLVKYKNPGKTELIKSFVDKSFPAAKTKEIKYEDLEKNYLFKNNCVFVDVSGLAKSIIFNAVRSAVTNNCTLYLCHTEAESYYPTDSEIEKVYNAHKKKDHYEFINSLEKILGGEKPPYTEVNLLDSESNESRNRVLIAFVRPKNERLYHILDSREYDKIELITPKEGSSQRSRVAKMAADLVAKKYINTNITYFDSNDLFGVLNFLSEKYQEYYVDLNYNIEIGLTGSKRQTIAVAVLSSICKFSKIWYIKPSAIDPKRFSKGVGSTNIFHITP